MIAKLFLGCVVFTCGWIWLEQYRTTEVIESHTAVMQKYEKSGLHAALDKDRFEYLAGRLPKVMAFLVSMDPAASRNALKRWFILVLIGWFHFCFISRWPDKVFGMVPRNQIFMCPIGLTFFFLALKLMQAVMGYFSTDASKYFNFLVQSFFWLSLVSFVGASLFSIPASFSLFVFDTGKAATRVLIIAGCQAWILKEKVLGAPKSGVSMKISECISQKLNQLAKCDVRSGPALPGPIIRRMEIDGVKYDY